MSIEQNVCFKGGAATISMCGAASPERANSILALLSMPPLENAITFNTASDIGSPLLGGGKSSIIER